MIFFSLPSSQRSFLCRGSVSLRRIEFIQKVLASHFSLGVLSMLLPLLLPSTRRYSRLVHASLIISGRPADWRAKKSDEWSTGADIGINISYGRRAMCSSFMNISACHALFIISYFSKPPRARMPSLSRLLLKRDSLRFCMKLSTKIQSVQKKIWKIPEIAVKYAKSNPIKTLVNHIYIEKSLKKIAWFIFYITFYYSIFFKKMSCMFEEAKSNVRKAETTNVAGAL